jgi:N-dimethylarginine dimethylaminohydrolase
MPAKTSGSEPHPATLGGDGWLARVSSHREEVAAGQLWTRCGQRSETQTLRSVLLMMPPPGIASMSCPNDQLMHQMVSLEAMRLETAGLAAAFERFGVEVHVYDPGPGAPLNIVFARDLFFLCPDGAVIGRMASAQRAGEERHAAAALSALGVPILRTVTGRATFEGADALWLTEGLVVVGTGFRTNMAGARMLAEVLRDYSVEVVEVPLGLGVQHLLGSIVPLDAGLAAVYSQAITPPLRAVLRAVGYTTLEFGPSPDMVLRRGMNLVPVGHRQVLMPARARTVRQRLEASGVTVAEATIDEHLKAAGGIACMTGILGRWPE